MNIGKLRKGTGMNTRFLDAGTIRTALTLASRAPSVHNTQPWRWLVEEASLQLYADPGRLYSLLADGRTRSCAVSIRWSNSNCAFSGRPARRKSLAICSARGRSLIFAS